MGTLKKLLYIRFSRVKKNTFVFTSFSGHYSDNPKYISIALHNLNPQANIIWLVNENAMPLLPDYVQGHIIGSREADKAQAQAEVIVDNVYGERAYTSFGSGFAEMLKKCIFRFCYGKKTQFIFTTWHGTPLKCMGRDQVGNNVSDFICGNLNMTHGNSFTAEKMNHLTFGKIPMQLIGTPRNDILFSDVNKINEIKIRLGLPLDKKIILFAPTFRNDGKDVEGKNVQRSGLNQLNEMDYHLLAKSLTNRFGGEWIIVCRFHYHVEKMVNWDKLNKKYNNNIVNGNVHDDMAEYLACTDVLITDASSSMFDFSLTKRPCFLYFPDLENYEKKERGFYLQPRDLPFPIAETSDELYSIVETFDEGKYISAVEKMHKDLGFVDDERSSERVAEYILKKCNY